MTTNAIVFLRPEGGAGFGHVGWGLLMPDGKWVLGSMENPSGWVVNLPGWSGFWYCDVADALAGMRAPVDAGAPKGSPKYKSYKQLAVLDPHVSAAEKKIKEWMGRPFLAAGGNCLNCTYDVLTAYGAAVPDPTPNPQLWAPNNWFNAVSGKEVLL